MYPHLFVLSMSCLSAVAGAQQAPVFAQDFEGLASGSTWLKSCKWNKHTRVDEGCGVGAGKCLRIAHDPFNREPSLYPLPDKPPTYGKDVGQCSPFYTNTATDVVQAVQPLPPALEYTLSYDVLFEPGYDWARGGKLPGLSAKRWDSGCSIEREGSTAGPAPDKWSVRVMWREAGTNELYVYDQDREPGACGARAATQLPFTTGRWHAISIHVKLNASAEAHDGEARLFIDGKLAREEKGLRLRAVDTPDSQINLIFFSTFFGGNEARRLHQLQNDAQFAADPLNQLTWVPKTKSVTRFDNIAVHPGLHVRPAPAN